MTEQELCVPHCWSCRKATAHDARYCPWCGTYQQVSTLRAASISLERAIKALVGAMACLFFLFAGLAGHSLVNLALAALLGYVAWNQFK